jgi:DNA polymerase III alpha subunit (gram-positive type)
MVFGGILFLGLALAGHASHGDVVGVVNRTEEVISKLQTTAANSTALRAKTSKMEAELDQAGRRAEANFDVQLYRAKENSFSESAQLASEKARQSSSSTNATVAGELSEKAETALRNMTKADVELDAMEKGLRDELEAALTAKLKPELALKKETSSLQHEAHKMMDPLYSMGDAAEDKADDLNDQTNDAESIADKALREYRRHIVRHARRVQRSVERKLFSGTDRAHTWREVHKLVSAATLHASSPGSSIVGLQLGSAGGLTVLVATSAAAAMMGALAVGFARKTSAARRSDYQLLLA